MQSLFSGVNGHGQGGLSFFGSNLPLVGDVDLPPYQVLHYTVVELAANDPTQYLVTEAFADYDGLDNWTRGQRPSIVLPPTRRSRPQPVLFHPDTYTIIFDAIPHGGEHFILAPGSNAASFSVPSVAQTSVLTHEPVTWLAQHPLGVGDSYSATGYVSTASVNQLETIPYPEQAATAGQDVYPQSILVEYLPTEPPISPLVAQTAQTITKGSPGYVSGGARAARLSAHVHLQCA